MKTRKMHLINNNRNKDGATTVTANKTGFKKELLIGMQGEYHIITRIIGGGAKTAEGQDGENTFTPTNSSKEHLNAE